MSASHVDCLGVDVATRNKAAKAEESRATIASEAQKNMEIPVTRIMADEHFMVGPTEYKMLYHNSSRAYVQIMSKRSVQIKATDEHEGTSFDAPGGKVNISCGTLVIRVETPQHARVSPSDMAKVKACPDSAAKLPPVNPETKVGQIMNYALGKTVSMAKLMEKFGVTRGCALSHLARLRTVHGFTYTVSGDEVTLDL